MAANPHAEYSASMISSCSVACGANLYIVAYVSASNIVAHGIGFILMLRTALVHPPSQYESPFAFKIVLKSINL